MDELRLQQQLTEERNQIVVAEPQLCSSPQAAVAKTEQHGQKTATFDRTNQGEPRKSR